MKHRKEKDSAVIWFIISLIPILNFYFNWKAAKLIAGHKEDDESDQE